MEITANKTIKSETERINNKIEDRTTFFYHAFRNILLICLPLLAVSGFILSISHSSATSDSSATTSAADHLDFSVPVSCTLASNVEAAHSATLLNGTYKDNIGKTILTAYCNDSNGYTVYVAASSLNSNNHSILASSVNSDYDIITGTATSGSTSAWAMKLSKSNINTNIDSNGNTVVTNNITTNVGTDDPTINPSFEDKYAAVPASWTPVVSKANTTVSSQTGSSFTTTYAAYTSTTQPAGTYTGLVRYLLMHDNSSIPTPTYFMQDVAFWKDDLALNQSVQAIDERDGKKYWVTKLADGNIWMTQNLDLCIGCEGVAALTSENTDISTDPTITGTGIYNTAGGYSESGGVWTWTPANSAITSGKSINYNNNSVYGWANNATLPYSAEGNDVYYYTSNSSTNDIQYNSLSSCMTAGHIESDCEHYHAGNYYNWTAAVASNDSSSSTTNNSKADNSICPKNWRLPYTSATDNSYNEFGRLFYNSAYNITNSIASSSSVGYKTGGFNALRANPLWFARSGVVIGTLNSPGTNGLYWSNTVNNKYDAYGLYFNNSNVSLTYYTNSTRSYGRSLRCLAR